MIFRWYDFYLKKSACINWQIVGSNKVIQSDSQTQNEYKKSIAFLDDSNQLQNYNRKSINSNSKILTSARISLIQQEENLNREIYKIFWMLEHFINEEIVQNFISKFSE